MTLKFSPRAREATIECDTCGEIETFEDVDSLLEGAQEAFRHGWKATQEDRQWTHECKGCRPAVATPDYGSL